MEKQSYTVKQVADILGYSTNSIYAFLKTGKIKGIRMGKGKFHILKGELQRLLQIKDLSPSPLLSTNPGQILTGSNIVGYFNEKQAKTPCLFDWFFSLSSIFLGFSMFLFVGYLEEYVVKLFSPWLLPVKVTFITAGFGLLLVNIIGKPRSFGYWVFYSAINISFVFFSVMFFRLHDSEAVAFFGLLVLVAVINAVFNIKGTAGFVIYLMSLIYVVPLVILLFPSIIKLPTEVLSIFLSKWLKIMMSLGLSLTTSLLLWFGYHKKRIVYWCVLFLLLTVVILLSLSYATELCWGRSFFILMIGFSSLFIPIWGTFKLSDKKDRLIIYKTLGIVLMLFLLIVGNVLLLQGTMWRYANRELINKLKYGRLFVESILDHGRLLLENAAKNDLLIEAVNNNDQKALTDLMRGIFSGNSNFKRVLILNAEGDILGYYPSGKLDKKNLSFREHFIKAVTTRRTYISDLLETVFETTTPQDKSSYIVVMATPIIGKNQEIIGVLDASFDLEVVGNRLQQVATPANNEYFTVVDKYSHRIIDVDKNLINTPMESKNQFLKGNDEEVKINESYNSEGKRTLQVYTAIPQVNWVIVLSQPYVSIFKSGQGAYLILLCVAIVSGLIIFGFLSRINRRKTAL